MAKKVVAMILAGGRGSRLSVLANKRAKPAVPFAGKYRIIDFTLSNCVNSGIYTVGVLTQYRPRSLQDHIRNGAPWDLDRLNGGVWILQPYLGRMNTRSEWYVGTADAVYQNLDFIRGAQADIVLVLSGDHVYKMDYTKLLRFHEDNQAEVTVSALQVREEEAHRFGILQVDAKYRILHFEEKPKHPKSNLASMGIYVFNRDVLEEVLIEDAHNEASEHDFGKNIFPKLVEEERRVFAYPFNDFGGYWVDVGTIQSYWEAHMDLLRDDPPLDLLARDWVIHTRSEERPPVNIRTGATVSHSLITDGCVIEGFVEYSVLSPGVRVERGAVVRNSIIMTDAKIEAGAYLDRVIVDKNVIIGREAEIGKSSDFTANPEVGLSTGITVIGKNTIIPPRMKIGRNVVIGSDLKDDDFPEFIPSGTNFKVEAHD
ncbi:MAG: glucose-1-phosphate adenylyltransferase [Thermoflexales bacterium]|nr:glucose-1-phosphate adenylyltransferase [Thermoflexales bacterium]MCS7325417.1 glucose-1-phosphate adenylyltransferase [Thermoflexales bacterium]MCX7939319.1 glucose-1-phosphate adenylyltransferase [Thermoflexales bacterium]MDW8054146.1 glucose-1-phosphate adenylyltransferase [Anaerolineae bacterium]MDW8292334.1 glucose-1-phosphate adenylyltransferase [Anaerolineae bacterium]